MPFSPTDLLATVARSRQPYLTSYAGPDGGERVELSGHVLAQWVAKAANLLDEEGVGTGDLVVVDLPVHWRAVVWIWATWVRGARVSFVPDDRDAAVVVTDRPGRHAGRTGGPLVIAVPLAPLAFRWEGELPDGVVDGGAALPGQPDALVMPGTFHPEERAVETFGLTFDDLDAALGTGDGTRIAFTPGSVWKLARTALSAWRGGGSVVVFSSTVTPERRRVLERQEGARPVD